MGGDVYLCYVFAELGNFLADKKIKISTLEIRLRVTKFIRTRDKLAELCALDHVVAAGECGLDFNRDFSPRDQRRDCFAAHLELAARNGMPMFLYERDAFDEFYAMMSEA